MTENGCVNLVKIMYEFPREVNLVESVLCFMKKEPSPGTVDIKSTDQRGQQRAKKTRI